MSYLASVLMVVGAAFCALAALGIVRFPDVYTRLHAASKAGPLGAGLILLAVAAASADWAIAVRGILGCGFLVLTAPLAAHLLARAALRSGAPLASITSIREHDGNG